MTLTYSNILDNGDWFDASPLMLSFNEVRNVINGNIEQDNISASSNITCSFIKTTETFASTDLIVKNIKFLTGTTVSLKKNGVAFFSIT